MAVFALLPGWFLFYTDVAKKAGTASVEATAAGDTDCAGHVAFQPDEFLPGSRIHQRNGGEQGLGIGMIRGLQDIRRVT